MNFGNKKEGFTLIELLAVIVVLTIIALIAIPIIFETIITSKEKAMKISVDNIVKSIENEHYLSLLEERHLDMITITYHNSIEQSNTPGFALAYQGKRPESGVIMIYQNGDISMDLIYDEWCVKKERDHEIQYFKWEAEACKVRNYPQSIFAYEYTGDLQTFVVPYTGNYQIELWGASGGGEFSGKGAYTRGNIYLEKDEELIIVVGENPNHLNGGYNGGGSNSGMVCNQGGSGGGATDVRIGNQLVDRIMVAAGGGGTGCNRSDIWRGGSGGTLTGISAYGLNTETPAVGKGATQIEGGDGGTWVTHAPGHKGIFGQGGHGSNQGADNRNSAGGGGGYYGGGSGASCGSTCSFSGGGGSSYISGHTGVNSVSSTGVHTGLSTHFSGSVFTNTIMIDGESPMPSTGEGSVILGNTGHGYIRITYGILLQLNGSSTIEISEGDSYVEPGAMAQNVTGEDLSNFIEIQSGLNTNVPGIYAILYRIYDENMGLYKSMTRTIVVKPKSVDFFYTGGVQTFVVPNDGYYRIETWGAAGGGTFGGKGAYTSGVISLTAGTVLNVVVGEKPNHLNGGYNGGGRNYGTVCNQGGSGGGATDIRLGSRLIDRIMVSAGGGGSGCGRSFNWRGGSGGELSGIHAYSATGEEIATGKGGTQTLGGTGGTWSNNAVGQSGGFGFGGVGSNQGVDNRNGAGGGGGYYGGGSGASCSGACSFSGGGGSSFISGYEGSNAVNAQGIHVGNYNHFSGYRFANSVMIHGEKSMPDYVTGQSTIGNDNHGHAKIMLTQFK